MGHFTTFILFMTCRNSAIIPNFKLKISIAHNVYIKLCADGAVVIAISLFPEVRGSIPERGKKRRFTRRDCTLL